MKEYSFTLNGREYQVMVKTIDRYGASVCVNGKDYEAVFSDKKAAVQERVAGKITGNTAQNDSKNPVEHNVATSCKVTSPLPGIVVELCVSTGQRVRAGQKVAVLEAMKMENDILTECDGTVGQVYVAEGDSVQEGTSIIEIK